jgi:hypothetical protein
MFHEPSRMNHVFLRRLGHEATLDAFGASLDLAMRSVHECVDDLQVRLEQARGDSGDVLADAALFLCLAAPQDFVPTNVAFATNFTTSRHDIAPLKLQGANNNQMTPRRQGQTSGL